MNIYEKNLNLDTETKNQLEEQFLFLKDCSNKEVTLRIEGEKDCFKFKIFFDIDNKDCIVDTRAANLRDGIFRLKNKTKKVITSEQRKLKNMESIRTMEIKKDKEYEFKYINLNSIDKPIEEKDAKQFMLQNKIDTVMFINIDKDYCLSILQRKKDKFDLYISNYCIS